MRHKVILNSFVRANIFFNIFYNLNIIYIKGWEGVVVFHMPTLFFIRSFDKRNFELCFLHKHEYFSFLKQLLLHIRIFYKFFFVKLRLKGLGYRIKKYDKNLYRFFVGYNHYFYFYTPENVYIWHKKRNFLILSIEKVKINNIFMQLLLLKKLDFFERTNSFISYKKILYLKK